MVEPTPLVLKCSQGPSEDDARHIAAPIEMSRHSKAAAVVAWGSCCGYSCGFPEAAGSHRASTPTSFLSPSCHPKQSFLQSFSPNSNGSGRTETDHLRGPSRSSGLRACFQKASSIAHPALLPSCHGGPSLRARGDPRSRAILQESARAALCTRSLRRQRRRR